MSESFDTKYNELLAKLQSQSIDIDTLSPEELLSTLGRLNYRIDEAVVAMLVIHKIPIRKTKTDMINNAQWSSRMAAQKPLHDTLEEMAKQITEGKLKWDED